ncbi:teichuronopeptide biosynthesis [Oceanobacillus sp. E9]|uniref:ATP-grasp fold amidoligase family protein n=1 Tax=Oceanobacillus sp. E9 TaxID=1742575 RepID=UPI00084E419E|nr:ATP-grasp fold amidoligase family protein [Oceanobacillus sp. E9]OEH55945.1 teichuronopeptide biosynthesis [Oceanobacillus sp. E9]
MNHSTEQGYAEQLDQLIETEAKVNKTKAEIKKHEKLIKQIVESKSLKKTARLRKLTSSNKEKDIYIKNLEEEIMTYHFKLSTLKEESDRLRMQMQRFDYESIWRYAKNKKDNGEIIELLNQYINQHSIAHENFNHLLQSVARIFSSEPYEYKKHIYQKLFEVLKEKTPEFMVRSAFSNDNFSLKKVASYRASLTNRMRQYQIIGELPEMLLDDKKTAYRFMESQQVRIPWSSSESYTYKQIPQQANMVIKPVDGAGGRGVYIVNDINDIINVKNAERLSNWDLLLNRMEKDILENRVEKDQWIIEELILENKNDKIPARDIKFYCFYGQVGLVLEIIRTPETKYCWWDAEGNRVFTGKYNNSLFEGTGVSNDEMELAAQISSLIPAPFIRIDFLKSEDGLVFGEFTPKPGNYDEFDNETDELLGNYFLKAQGKLEYDLINGKQFLDYKKIKQIANNGSAG